MAVVNESENLDKSQEKSTSAKVEKIDVDQLESAAELGAEAAKFASEVADLGIDSAESAESGEGFSEGKGNKKDYSVRKASSQTQQDLKAHVQQIIPIKIMQKQVATAIRKEIRKEERKVLLAYVGIRRYSPHKLAEMIAKIRSLRDLLSSLVDATKEILMGLWLKWVRKET